MKAKVRATGEIVEVERLNHRIYGRIDGGAELYRKDMLDFNLDPPQPSATISGWVARDKDGCIQVYKKLPKRNDITNDEWGMEPRIVMLPIDAFPSLTWQDEPIEVEIIIKPKRQ